MICVGGILLDLHAVNLDYKACVCGGQVWVWEMVWRMVVTHVSYRRKIYQKGVGLSENLIDELRYSV